MTLSDNRFDLVAFGDAYVRLSAAPFQRLEQSDGVDVFVAGNAIEAAVAASRLGQSSAWLSVITENPLGRKIENKAREHGVDTTGVCRSPHGRVGLVYSESGSAPRESTDIDDREGASFDAPDRSPFDWTTVGRGRTLLLDLDALARYPGMADGFSEAAAATRGTDCKVAVCLGDGCGQCSDDRFELVRQALGGADAVLAMVPAAKRIAAPNCQTEDLAAAVHEVTNANIIAVSERILTTPRSATWRSWAIETTEGGETVQSDGPYQSDVIDRSGAFGAFVGVFLSHLSDTSLTESLAFGNVAATLSHSIPGNLLWTTRADIESQISGTGKKLQR